MSYIDAYFDERHNLIRVVEKQETQRVYNDLAPVYEFYYQDSNGKYVSIKEEKLSKIECDTYKEYKQKVKEFKEFTKLYESDHNIVFKTLAKYYKNTPPANINIAFFDIENDIDPNENDPGKMAQDPTMPITAITVFKKWQQKSYTYVIKPETQTLLEAQTICNNFENVWLCSDEKALLKCFLDCIQDVDILSGWNSQTYDIPYIVGRIQKVLGDTYNKQLCLWSLSPKETKVEKYGKFLKTYELIGRIHMDYLELYKKHNQQGKDSYSLNSIGEEEVGETKIDYDGTLDDLYKYNFEKFIAYNIQDTLLLAKIDKKLEYITLHYHIAHANKVTIGSTKGSVGWIDQSIINEAHDMNMIVPDKISVELDKPAAGARVADAVVGLHNYVGAIDLASEYPSTIRSLNMSLETMFGQVVLKYTDMYLYDKIEKENLYKSENGVREIDWTSAWHGLFSVIEYDMIQQKTDDELEVIFHTGEKLTTTAKDLYDFIYNNNLCISANATIFRNDKEGVIPHLLTRWFNERKSIKNNIKTLNKLKSGIKLDEELLLKLQELTNE